MLSISVSKEPGNLKYTIATCQPPSLTPIPWHQTEKRCIPSKDVILNSPTDRIQGTILDSVDGVMCTCGKGDDCLHPLGISQVHNYILLIQK